MFCSTCDALLLLGLSVSVGIMTSNQRRPPSPPYSHPHPHPQPTAPFPSSINSTLSNIYCCCCALQTAVPGFDCCVWSLVRRCAGFLRRSLFTYIRCLVAALLTPLLYPNERRYIYTQQQYIRIKNLYVAASTRYQHVCIIYEHQYVSPADFSRWYRGTEQYRHELVLYPQLLLFIILIVVSTCCPHSYKYHLSVASHLPAPLVSKPFPEYG